MTQEQRDEVNIFRANLNKNDEWLFFNIAAATKIGNAVMYEDYYRIMQKWDFIMTGE